GWLVFRGRCYLVSWQTADWAYGQQHCQGEGGHLAVIRTPEDQGFLFWAEGEPNNHIDEDCGYMVKTRKVERVAIRSWFDAPCSHFWPFIYVLPPPHPSSPVTSDASECRRGTWTSCGAAPRSVSIRRRRRLPQSQAMEPSTNREGAYSKLTEDDGPPGQPTRFGPLGPGRVAPVLCPEGWLVFQGRCYLVSQQSADWASGQRYCQGQGGHLAVIRTPEDQGFLWDQLPRGHWNAYWIGLSDEDTEGHWKWVDGTPLIGGFWAEGEPNNHIDEDCGYMVKTTVTERVAIRSWVDAPCKAFWPFICQRDPALWSTAAPVLCPEGWLVFQGRCYLVSKQTANWASGQQHCQGEGGHLAVIRTPEDQGFLWDQLPRGHWNAYWIGLSDEDTEGHWKWVDGTPLIGGFWAEGEPNNDIDEDCGYMVKTTVTERVAIRSWVDAPCTAFWPFICQRDPLPTEPVQVLG
ncbi:hypothetical protein NHX12_024158, partial [Muraenolepis orangiensis]